MNIVNRHLPIRMTYLNSKRREIEVYGTYSSPIIYVGADKYFKQLSDESVLVKVNGANGITVGKILNFEYLEVDL